MEFNESFTNSIKIAGHIINSSLKIMTDREKELFWRRLTFQMFILPTHYIKKKDV